MSRAFIQKRLPFKPTDIGGCQLWLDAADATTVTFSSGSNVNTWNDKSGNSRNVSTSISAPTYSSTTTGLIFNGTSQYLQGPSAQLINPSDGSWSVFCVVVPLTQSGGDGLGSILDSDRPTTSSGPRVAQFIYYNSLSTALRSVSFNSTSTANSLSFSPTTPIGTRVLGGCILNTSTITAYGNGVAGTPANSVLNTAAAQTFSVGAAFQLGSGILTASVFFNGTIHEIVHYNTSLTDPQRQQVESYLAQKWGLRQQLPQGHPGTRGIVYPSDPVNLLVRLPYSSTFTPSAVGTVSMWLDGADPAGTGTPLSNGATVSTWVDKSGSGINLTAVGTPTYTSANLSVYLDGSSYLQNTNFNFTNYTLFIVSNQASADGPLYTNKTTGLTTSGFFPRYSNGNYYLVQSDSAWLSGTSPFSNGTTYIYSIQYDSLNNINLWSNGSISPVITGTAGTITRNKFLLGKRSVGGFQESMTGNVFEIVQYNSDLGQTARQQVEGYLAWKWGLQANLPPTHPYKAAAPSVPNALGISRPANVPIPPIQWTARARPVFLYTATFTYSAAGNQTFQVPSTIRPATVTVYMWGAGAGGNTNYGGAGAMVQGVLTVIPGETLTIVVGQGGTIDGLNTYGGGGAGGGNFTGISPAVGIGYSFNGYPQNAGSGGGRSAIQRGGTDPTNDIVVAGGGGGGSYFSSDHGGAATFSGTANPGTGGLPGLGGTQSGPGAGGGVGTYGTGLTGSRGLGGDTYNNNIFNGAGGGGGGYYGGGGGGTNGGDGAGGGGGSSLTDGLSLISGQTVKGFNSANGFTAPNTASPYYQSGVGNGAPSINSSPRAGGNGLIVLIYYA